MTRIAEALTWGEKQLRPQLGDAARLEARLLLAAGLECDLSRLFAYPEQQLDASQLQRYQNLLLRRCIGEPLAYITGSREFWSLELEVGPDVLIPRPETELLVEQCLTLGDAESRLRVLDLGTGSGAVALAIARERPHWRILATDRSAKALAVAQRNAGRHRLDNLEFLQGSWYQAIPADERFDLIVSNPPYVAAEDPHLRRGDLRFEPREALTPGSSGLEAFEQIIQGAQRHLRNPGWLMLEHGLEQAEAVQALLLRHGFSRVSGHTDLEGRDRVTRGCLTA